MAGARVTEPRVVGACASSSSGFQRRLDGVKVVGAGELARRGDNASRAAAGRVDDAQVAPYAGRPKFYFCTGTAAVNKWWEILYQMNLADGALLNETAWSALVGIQKRSARDAAKAELAAE